MSLGGLQRALFLMKTFDVYPVVGCIYTSLKKGELQSRENIEYRILNLIDF